MFYPIAIPSGEAMVRCTLFVAVALSGCSQIFGLDKPVRGDAAVDAPDSDKDGDGVSDSVDNCDSVANPDQVDVDRDDVGDACQGCIILPLRAADDDDGDGLTDDIDNCTGLTSGAMQTDDDGDGIGNGCDPRAGADKRFCLWTFRDAVPPVLASVWSANWSLGATWSVANGALSHSASATPGLVETHNPYNAPSGIAVDTRMRLGANTPPASSAMLIRLDGAARDYIGCGASQPATGNAVVQLARNDVIEDQFMLPGSLPQNISAFVRMTVLANGPKTQVTCTFQAPFTVTLTAQFDLTFPGAHLGFGVDGIDVVFDHVSVYKLGL